MRCYRVRRLLSDEVDGACDPATARAVSNHLTHCPSCASAREKIERARALLLRARAPRPGENYWNAFWPRLERRLADAEEPLPSLFGRLCAVLSRQRLSGVLSPAPALAILALLCFNVFLLTQLRRGAPSPGRAPAPALTPALSNARSAPFTARAGGIEVGRGAARPRIDAVLCDSAGRTGIDEYVLRSADLHRARGGLRGTSYILLRPAGYPARAASRGSY